MKQVTFYKLSIEMKTLLFLTYTIIILLIVQRLHLFMMRSTEEMVKLCFGYFSMACGIGCAFLQSRKDNRALFLGSLAVITFAEIAYRTGFVYDFALYAFLLTPLQITAFYTWHKNTLPNSHEVKPAKMKHIGILIIVILVATHLMAFHLYDLVSVQLRHQPSDLTLYLRYFDAGATVLSLVAQYCMVKRYVTQWVVWILADIFSFFMWLSKSTDFNNLPVILMILFYFLNSIYGYYQWNRAYHTS